MHKVITPPTVEPITLADARLHVRQDLMVEDTLISGWISAAREHCENYTGIAFAPQTWEIALDVFPDAIALEGGFVDEIVLVGYYDEDGNSQSIAFSGYALDSYSSPNWLVPKYGTTWPASYDATNALTVRYKVGSQPVPASVRAAMLLLIGHFYANREQIADMQTFALPLGVKALLDPYRVNWGV
jgi:uncharacterized phiE125 gp8 family phage protein